MILLSLSPSLIEFFLHQSLSLFGMKSLILRNTKRQLRLFSKLEPDFWISGAILQRAKLAGRETDKAMVKSLVK